MTALISCIMPTADRPQFVGHAVRQFLAQMYRHKELIVLDNGNRGIERFVPEHPDVKYFRTSPKDCGELRNEAISHAQGDIIAHWDDDDLHNLDQLTYLWNFMDYNSARIVGISRPLFLDIRTNEGWRHEKDEHGWVHGSAMMYRRELAELAPFCGAIGSDRWFVKALVAKGIIPIPVARNDVHVNLIHGENLSPKLTNRAGWVRESNLPLWLNRAEYHEVLKNGRRISA